ncbi:hypothetical protein Tco_0527326 [Tanacetum coccineum]
MVPVSVGSSIEAACTPYVGVHQLPRGAIFNGHVSVNAFVNNFKSPITTRSLDPDDDSIITDPYISMVVHLTLADIERFNNGTHSLIDAANLLNIYNIHVWISEDGIPIWVQTPSGNRTLEVVHEGVNRHMPLELAPRQIKGKKRDEGEDDVTVDVVDMGETRAQNVAKNVASGSGSDGEKNRNGKGKGKPEKIGKETAVLKTVNVERVRVGWLEGHEMKSCEALESTRGSFG